MRGIILCVLALVAMATGPRIVMGQHACDPQRLAPPGGGLPVRYGEATATNGRFWFVGDRAARTYCSGTSLGCQAGAVHVYELIDGRLERVQTIVPSDVASGANFGASLAVDGDRLVVGAYQSRWPDGLARGAVYVYEFDGTRWEEAARIAAPVDVPEGFGSGVLLDQDTMIVWPNLSHDRVYSYRRTSGEWTLVETIRPDVSVLNMGFGIRMAMDDRWLFVGAPFDDAVAPNGGSVYVYQRSPSGLFEFVQRLDADFTARFGNGIAYNGRHLFVGMPGYQPIHYSQGGVLAYRFDGQQWTMAQALTHGSAERNHGFGSVVQVQDQVLLAATEQESGPRGRGTVYEFHEGPDGVWREVRRLDPDPLRYISFGYGSSISLHGSHAIVGSAEDRDPDTGERGAVYFFDLACNPCPPDLDADGSLTVFDFLTFLNLFQDADPIADFDGDGQFTIFDFLAFQTAFDAGC